MNDKHDSNSTLHRFRFRLEELCTEFEQSWRTDRRTQTIEEILPLVELQFRSDAFTELLAVELELRSEAGESPVKDDYELRFPDYSTEVGQSFEHWQSETKAAGTAAYDFPERIGDYRIIRKLGEGGMGVVYEAVQESLDRRVAIKSLGVHPVHAPRLARRFRREARAVAMLHHTNIVNVYGSGVHHGVPYFAMQLVEGRSLRQMINDAKKRKEGLENATTIEPDPLSIMNVARMGVQIASALDYAHQQGILHRDIKPSNLLVDKFGTTWVSDFGLAKLKDSVDATFSGDVVGTLRYVPPEATQGEWSELGDVYSLGITLYELLALKPAFPETEHVKLLHRITRGEPPIPLRRANTFVPRDLETVISKAISREPTIRYSTAAELGKELQRYVDGEPILARPTSSTERVVKWSMRNPGPAALLGLVLVLITFGFPTLTVLWLRSQNALESVKTERTNTEIAKIDAVVARKVAEIARIDAEVSKYGSAMQLAQKYVEDGNVAEVEQLLANWNLGQLTENALIKDRRGWEWNFIKNRTDQSRLTFSSEYEYVWDVAISPDDTKIATVHAADPIQKTSKVSSKVFVWDATNGEVFVGLPETEDRIYSITFSPDGSLLATFGLYLEADSHRIGRLAVWDAETGSLINGVDLPGRINVKNLTLHFKPLLPKVSFSRDGKQLLVSQNSVEIRDADTLESIAKFQGYEGVFLDESTIAVLGANRKLQSFDIDTRKLLFEKTLSRRGFDLTSSSNGKLSVNLQSGLRVLGATNRDSIVKFENPIVHWGALEKNGQRLLLGNRDGEIQVFQTSTSGDEQQSVQRFIGHQSTITCGQISHSGTWMVTGSLDGTAKVWDLKKNKDTYVGNTNLKHEVLVDICFSQDNHHINFVGRGQAKDRPNAGTYLLNSDDQSVELQNKAKLDTTRLASWPRSDFAFSPCRRFIAAPMNDNSSPKAGKSGRRIGFWSCERWQQYAELTVPYSRIDCICWSDDGRFLAVAGIGENQEVKIFQTPDENIVEANAVLLETLAVSGNVRAMNWSGNRLAMGLNDKIEIYSMSLERSAKEPSSPKTVFSELGKPSFLCFSPDGENLAVALKELGKFRVYDLKRDELRYERPAPRDVCCVRYHPHGNRIALSGYDSLVYLCDAETGHRLLSLVGSPDPPGGFSINARVAFSPDGRKIATNNWKGEITIWEADSVVQP